MLELLCSYGAARAVHLLAHHDDLQTAAAVFAVNPALADDPAALGSAASEAFVRLMLRYQPDLPKRVGLVKSREVTELLFAHGMNPSHPDWLGITPLHEIAPRQGGGRHCFSITARICTHATKTSVPLRLAGRRSSEEGNG
jgi:hypothetical protein